MSNQSSTSRRGGIRYWILTAVFAVIAVVATAIAVDLWLKSERSSVDAPPVAATPADGQPTAAPGTIPRRTSSRPRIFADEGVTAPLNPPAINVPRTTPDPPPTDEDNQSGGIDIDQAIAAGTAVVGWLATLSAILLAWRADRRADRE